MTDLVDVGCDTGALVAAGCSRAVPWRRVPPLELPACVPPAAGPIRTSVPASDDVALSPRCGGGGRGAGACGGGAGSVQPAATGVSVLSAGQRALALAEARRLARLPPRSAAAPDTEEAGTPHTAAHVLDADCFSASGKLAVPFSPVSYAAPPSSPHDDGVPCGQNR